MHQPALAQPAAPSKHHLHGPPQLAAPQGATAHFLRVGPHTVFTFLILEQVQRLMRQQAAKQQQQAGAVAAAKQG